MTSIAETLALAERLATGITPYHAGVTGDVRRIANACLVLDAALRRCRENDRSAAYEPGEPRPDGARPPSPSPTTKWLTPRELVDAVLGVEAERGGMDG